MNLFKLSMTCLIAFGLASCAPTEEKAVTNGKTINTADTSGVDKARNEFISAFNAADPAKVGDVYTADAVMMPTHQPVITGRAAIEDYQKKFFEMYSAKIAITPTETKVFGDRGLDRGTYTLELTPKAGGSPVKDEGKYLVLFQHQSDGSWKVTHDIDNTSIPAAAPPPAKPEPKKK